MSLDPPPAPAPAEAPRAAPPATGAAPRPGTVLVVDDDPVLVDLVRIILTDEGYAVSVLTTVASDAVRTAVGRLEPDCLLLDSHGPTDYGDSWLDAAWAQTRARAVPVIMFTANAAAVQEAAAGESPRSREARLFAAVAKPFELDDLLTTVAQAVGSAAPFERAGAD